MAENYTWSNGRYGVEISNGKFSEFIDYGNDFEIVEISENLDSKEIYLTLKFKYLGKEDTVTIPRTDAMDRNKILKYVGTGLDISSTSAKVAIAVLQKKERGYCSNGKARKYTHKIVGWKDVLVGDETRKLFFGENGNKEFSSTYTPVIYDIAKKGTAKEWCTFVKKHYLGITELEFIISVSLAAILHGYLKGLVDCDNFFVGLVGESTTGKSCMLALATSVFGNPAIGSNTLTSTWNSTDNALLAGMFYGRGYLFCLDEMSTAGKHDMTKQVYALSGGIDKKRLTKEGDVMERREGTYLVMYSGESSLLSKTNNNEGLRMRVLEFVSKQWTSSAEQAEEIKRFAHSQYGAVAPLFAKNLVGYVYENGIDVVLDLYQQYRELYLQKCSRKVRQERISGRYAMILLGAHFAKELLALEFDVDKICDFIIENENTGFESIDDSIEDFYNDLLSWVWNNLCYFVYTGKDDNGITKDIVGRIDHYAPNKYILHESDSEEEMYVKGEISFCEKGFKKIVQKIGREDEKAMISALKRKCYLNHERGRNYRKRKVAGDTEEKVYVIRIIAPMTKDEKEESKKIERMKKRK